MISTNEFLSPASVKLPLIGSLKGEYELFQYLLHSVNSETIEIKMPRWVRDRYQLRISDTVNFHINFKFKEYFYSKGLVIENQEDIYALKLLNANECSNLFYGYYDIESSQWSINSHNEVILKFMKNIVMVKKGIKVYLKHLIPYFSRITGYDREDYPVLKKLLLNNIKDQLKKNTQMVEDLYETVLNQNTSEKMMDLIPIEELYSSIQPEINLDILNLTFGDMAHIPYIVSIKELEEKLFWNYNSLVVLYSCSLVSNLS